MLLTVYAKPDCPDFARSRAVLDSMGIDFEFRDVSADPTLAQAARGLSGSDRTPVIVIPGGAILVEPADEDLRAALATY